VIHTATQSGLFIVEAADQELGCAVLQARFEVSDLDDLRAVLGEQAADDVELRDNYELDDLLLAAIVARFGVLFDPVQLECETPTISLFRYRRISEAPYLIHTGYELPLLLDGRKKLANMYHEYPPMTFDGENRFDDWVANGALHREEVLEPFDHPMRNYQGVRRVYYTPKGEEWRVHAHKLIWKAAGESGGWNEYFERLEGMLYGYEDWQNDWWINTGLQGGGFGGMALCCTVDGKGLAWIEASGFRALPPIEKPALTVVGFRGKTDDERRAFLLSDPNGVALIRFKVLGRHVMDLVNLRDDDTHEFPAEKIPELNRHLRGLVEIAARRDE
jgi:hypothetical protein